EINIIPQLLVKELGLECDTTTRLPIQSISGHALTVYGTTKVQFSIVDADGRRLDCEETFVTAKIAGHNMVLGDPWLARHDPDISHRTRTWRVRDDGESKANPTPAKLSDVRFVKAMKFKREASRRGAVAFAAYIIPEWPSEAGAFAGYSAAEVTLPPQYADYAEVFSKEA
ncbi:MAG: hypothetical protein M1823_008677, partial [Watsoniomyces obsoletus]